MIIINVDVFFMPNAKFIESTISLTESVSAFGQKIRTEINNAKGGDVIPGLNVPYVTKDTNQGRRIWAVNIDFGVLPNNNTKVVMLPATITDNWGVIGERWIDLGSSYVYHPSTGLTLTLPHASMVSREDLGGSGAIKNIFSDQIAIALNNEDIEITTQSNRGGYRGVICVKYLEAAV